uniref:RING-CH-type domain-containing protein n=1 Tax=Acrobeloides nanus TaxID=290746 RepID=A0A914CNT2_9BILA
MKASDCVIQIDAINDIPTCRICLDDTGTSELISPCNCRGTMEFVHRECLDKWYDVSGETVCGTCLGEYEAECIGLKPISRWWNLPREIDKTIIKPILIVISYFLLYTTLMICCILLAYKFRLPLWIKIIFFIYVGISDLLPFCCAFGSCLLLLRILTVWLQSLKAYRWKNKTQKK